MKKRDFAVVVKLWALLCTIAIAYLTSDLLYTGILALVGFFYLAVQHKWKLIRSMGIFSLLLVLCLYLIAFQGVHMIIFSEFYVLMFWKLLPVFLVTCDFITTPPGEIAAFLSRVHMPIPVILGLLVVFRFFPTMKAELKGVVRSMKNRGLTGPLQMIRHPAASGEYVLVPILLRCLQIADQLSVSAVARGAEKPGKRGSYYGKQAGVWDRGWLILWTLIAGTALVTGGGVL